MQSLIEKEGIPVKRFESGPGRSIIMARLKGSGAAKPILLLHHMDVVPTDAARWKRDPFGGELAEGAIWGRGAMDMKGPGVAHLYALIALKRMNVPLDRDIILMAVPDEEVGGGLGAIWMREHHYKEFEPEFILDEGGFGSRDLFSSGKLVFGISVAEKKILWLKLTAEGVAGHGSQPHDRNPNDRLVRALTKLLAEPMSSSPFSVVDTMKSKVGSLPNNKFNNAIQQSTISLTSLRSGVGEPPKVNVIPSIAEATARLPRAARYDEGPMAEGGREAARRSGDTHRGDLRVARSDDYHAGLDFLPGAGGSGQEATSRRDRHADDRALWNGREPVPAAWCEELRVHAGDSAGSRVGVDAWRRRVCSSRRARTSHSDSVRRLEGNRRKALSATEATWLA